MLCILMDKPFRNKKMISYSLDVGDELVSFSRHWRKFPSKRVKISTGLGCRYKCAGNSCFSCSTHMYDTSVCLIFQCLFLCIVPETWQIDSGNWLKSFRKKSNMNLPIKEKLLRLLVENISEYAIGKQLQSICGQPGKKPPPAIEVL